MGSIESFRLNKAYNIRFTFGTIFMIISAIFLLLSQQNSYKLDDLQNNRSETLLTFLSVKLGVTEIKVSMNEYLLRYVSSDIRRKYENEDFNVTQAEVDPFSINTYNPNLTEWFNQKTNVQSYFTDVGSLNSQRPEWYKLEEQFLTILVKADEEIIEKITSAKKWRNIYIWLSAISNIIGFLFFFSIIKLKKQE